MVTSGEGRGHKSKGEAKGRSAATTDEAIEWSKNPGIFAQKFVKIVILMHCIYAANICNSC